MGVRNRAQEELRMTGGFREQHDELKALEKKLDKKIETLDDKMENMKYFLGEQLEPLLNPLEVKMNEVKRMLNDIPKIKGRSGVMPLGSIETHSEASEASAMPVAPPPARNSAKSPARRNSKSPARNSKSPGRRDSRS